MYRQIIRNSILSSIIITLIGLTIFMQLCDEEVSHMQLCDEEVLARIIDSLLMGITIFSFIIAIEYLVTHKKLTWKWLVHIMDWHKGIIFIIGFILVLFFSIFYNVFWSQTSDLVAIIAFTMVLTGYLEVVKKEMSILNYIILEIITMFRKLFNLS